MTFKEWCEENNKEDLLNEWHSTKNESLKPTDVTSGSNKKSMVAVFTRSRVEGICL